MAHRLKSVALGVKECLYSNSGFKGKRQAAPSRGKGPVATIISTVRLGPFPAVLP